jgi:hypothetical protein
MLEALKVRLLRDKVAAVRQAAVSFVIDDDNLDVQTNLVLLMRGDSSAMIRK